MRGQRIFGWYRREVDATAYYQILETTRDADIPVSVDSSEIKVQVVTDTIWGFHIGGEGAYVHSTYGTSLAARSASS